MTQPPIDLAADEWRECETCHTATAYFCDDCRTCYAHCECKAQELAGEAAAQIQDNRCIGPLPLRTDDRQSQLNSLAAIIRSTFAPALAAAEKMAAALEDEGYSGDFPLTVASGLGDVALAEWRAATKQEGK